MRQYRRTVIVAAVRKADREGSERMKRKVIGLFEALGFKELNGLTAAEIVRSQV